MSQQLAVIDKHYALVTPSQNEWQMMREQAKVLLDSGFLPNTIRTPEQALTIMLKGRELNIPPMSALESISVIQGKPTVAPQLMLGMIERTGNLEDSSFETVTSPNGAFRSIVVTMKRRGRTAHSEEFGIEEATKMGLISKDNYKKQPATMCKWRAVAACARVTFPDVIMGLYTPDEMGANVNDEGEIIEVQASQKPHVASVTPIGRNKGVSSTPHDYETPQNEADDNRNAPPMEARSVQSNEPVEASPFDEIAHEIATIGAVTKKGDYYEVEEMLEDGEIVISRVSQKIYNDGTTKKEVRKTVCNCDVYATNIKRFKDFRCVHIRAVKVAVTHNLIVIEGTVDVKPEVKPSENVTKTEDFAKSENVTKSETETALNSQAKTGEYAEWSCSPKTAKRICVAVNKLAMLPERQRITVDDAYAGLREQYEDPDAPQSLDERDAVKIAEGLEENLKRLTAEAQSKS